MRMHNAETKKFFTTLDAYLSSFLALQGFTPRLIEEGEKVVFYFEEGDDLYKAIAEYNNGAVVEASRLAFMTKALKSQIFSMRRGNGNGNGNGKSLKCFSR